jgi:hypothetical protein
MAARFVFGERVAASGERENRCDACRHQFFRPPRRTDE